MDTYHEYSMLYGQSPKLLINKIFQYLINQEIHS